MRRLTLKKAKWYHSNSLIYQNNELIGEYFPESFRRPGMILLNGREFTLKTENVWKNKKMLYLGNIPVANISERSLKSETIIEMPGQGNFVLKQNIWKSLHTLQNEGKSIAEIKSKSFEKQVTAGDQVNDALLAAMLLTAIHRETIVLVFIALIPVYIQLFN